MTEQPRTRQELYDRIRQTGKEEFILQEMIRYGFWPAQGEIPQDPADEIRRLGELNRELQQLHQQNRQLHNEAALRKQLLKERLAESKRKQQETKERRERERKERAEAWKARKEQDILFLGQGVSGGLDRREPNLERLQNQKLPVFTTPESLASAMGVTIGQLRFLAFHRQVAKTCHYIRFYISKKTGGQRLISAPMPRLKQLQHWILRYILNPIAVNDAAHGFRQGHSILTNATPHVGADVVVNFDLKDFFPSISYKRVKGLFQALGYGEAIATILGLLCTYPDVEEVELDGSTYYVATGDRHLPQGSPASPAISNILCRRLDRRLLQMAQELGFTYTRYADDLTFSASGDNLRNICNLLKRTEAIALHEGFALNPSKTRIMRKNSQQEVTGIVVNQFPNISKSTLKRFRATLFQIERDGIAGKKWGNSTDTMAAIQGFAHFVAMVNPEVGTKFVEQVKQIQAQNRN
ncbi:reverse transcriptase family protein [Merismopedia glauca]|uniref:RNA-directed DNA polymerase n=1 Tax=Merismopedia glauca CCAP 1448/3 TaxID=1296344 RepID=A0A2T1C5M2_9CYAN|nr:reverse transcriptase family protein [Merismopedia glauca]PSB03546.1 RNA-dependent DNA polymerase [Merismopedia glauca CCAP 1448/3]